jgi:hypothetical protein
LALINSFDNFLATLLGQIEREILVLNYNRENIIDEEVLEEDDNFSVAESKIELIETMDNVVNENYIGYANQANSEQTISSSQDMNSIESLLSEIESKVTKSNDYKTFNEAKKEDILEGLSSAKKLIMDYIAKGAEVFSNNKWIIGTVKKQISKKNKRRRKAEYIISNSELNNLFPEL